MSDWLKMDFSVFHRESEKRVQCGQVFYSPGAGDFQEAINAVLADWDSDEYSVVCYFEDRLTGVSRVLGG